MLRKIRKERGISLSFVANKLGIDRATLRNIENGESSLKVEWVPILSELYGVSDEFIFRGYLKERRGDLNDKGRKRINKKIG